MQKLKQILKQVLKWIVGGLAVLGLGLFTIMSVDSLETSDLVDRIAEWAFLRSKGMKRKDDVIKTPEGDVDIPESVKGTVVAIDTENEHTETEGKILHEPEDRRNVQKITHNAKERLTK